MFDDRLGEVRRTGETYELVFERRLAKSVEKVWAALTTPERLADWLATADIDLRVGGRFELYWETHDYRMAGVIRRKPTRHAASPGLPTSTHIPRRVGNSNLMARAVA